MKSRSTMSAFSPASLSRTGAVSPSSWTRSGGTKNLAPNATATPVIVSQTRTISGDRQTNSAPMARLPTMKAADPIPLGQP